MKIGTMIGTDDIRLIILGANLEIQPFLGFNLKGTHTGSGDWSNPKDRTLWTRDVSLILGTPLC